MSIQELKLLAKNIFRGLDPFRLPTHTTKVLQFVLGMQDWIGRSDLSAQETSGAHTDSNVVHI